MVFDFSYNLRNVFHLPKCIINSSRFFNSQSTNYVWFISKIFLISTFLEVDKRYTFFSCLFIYTSVHVDYKPIILELKSFYLWIFADINLRIYRSYLKQGSTDLSLYFWNTELFFDCVHQITLLNLSGFVE